MRPLERVALWLLLTVGLCGCVHEEQHRVKVTTSETDTMASGVSVKLDSHDHGEIDDHTVTTTGPGEETDRWFAPDGGVARERVRRWGGSTSEGWLKQSSGRDEHLELDAGVAITHQADAGIETDDSLKRRPAASCAFGGYLWALAVIGVVVLGLRLLRRRAGS